MEKSKQHHLQKCYKECTRFFDDIYVKEQKILVFGEGDITAGIMLVGEAPGEQETLQRRPFVGKAGKNLNAFLEVLELARQELYITNVVKFRPEKTNPETGRKSNRPPNKEEIALFRRFLREEIGILCPKVIVTLGNVALKAVADNEKITIGEVHGTAIDVGLWEEKKQTAPKLFPLYHPASVIYNRDLHEVYQQDLQKLKEFLYK